MGVGSCARWVSSGDGSGPLEHELSRMEGSRSSKIASASIRILGEGKM